MTLTIRNPATGETLAELPTSSPAEVEAAVAAARASQPAWAARSLADRAAILQEFSRRLIADRSEVAALVTREIGKPIVESYGAEIITALDGAAWATKEGVAFLTGERIRFSNPLFQGRESRIEHEPLGVIGIVGPWNYPLAIPATQAVASLLSGNAVVLKPSSFSPLTALRLRDLLMAAGVPPETFQVVVGSGRETGAALVDSDIDHLIFTGSVPTGKAVAERVDPRGVSSCLELGGSDPAVVLEDAPMERTARGIAWARFTNAGQTCAAVKRAVVHHSLHHTFVEAIGAHASALRMGDPLAATTDMGTLIHESAVREMEGFVEDAVKRGARVVSGGKARPDLGPCFFEPTVLADVPPEARAVNEETFGPVLPVVSFSTEDEAVRLANATRFGLSASVWTRDTERGARLARRIEAGTVTVNDALYTYAATATPWGGFKESGRGRTHGRWGLEDLTRLRHINVVPAAHPVGSVWWFPYDDDLREGLDKGAAFLYGDAKDKARHGLGTASRLMRRRGA